ncbi:MAG: HNH endonuclease [Akkermansiaceae bacterium]
MAHARKNFTDNQKAQIYVRDRATCCFSGANLWLLDAPLSPGNQFDWVDHVQPSAKGGSSDVSNGVCASHTFNAKKRDNSADTFYLFQHGIPTSDYYEIFGALTATQQKRQHRLANLAVEDWFFNRAIAWINHAMHDRCYRDFYDCSHKRDANYWLHAAYKKLLTYQKKQGSKSLEDRGIVSSPTTLMTTWLTLRNSQTFDDLRAVEEALFPCYRRNYHCWALYFWDSESDADLEQARQFAHDEKDLCPSVLAAIESDFSLRTNSE